MTLAGSTALRLTIIVEEDTIWHHKPLYTEIVHRAHAAGLAGASVFRGIEGYGASNRIHTIRFLSLTEHLPVLIMIIDLPEKIEEFLPQVQQLVTRGVATVDEVHVVHHVYDTHHH